MVVRLKDLRAGQTSTKKDESKTGGIVRLSDIRKQESDKQIVSFKQAEQKFNPMIQDTSNPFVAPSKTSAFQSPADSQVMQQANQYNTDHPTTITKGTQSNADARANEKSRKIPVIGPILHALDKLSDTKAQHIIADVGQTLYTPGGTVANIAGFSEAVGSKLLQKAPNLTKTLAGRAANATIKEAVTGAPLGAGQALAQGQDNTDVLKGAAFGAALGGATGALIPFAGAGLGKVGELLKKPTPLPSYEGIGLNSKLGGKPKIVENQPSDYINSFKNLVKTEDINSGLKEIDGHLSELETQYTQALDGQYKFLKDSLENRQGVNQGGMIKDSNGEVINRYGRTSNNPEWYQQFYKENNRIPTNKDLLNLAQQHVDEGFTDSGVSIPSWKQQTGYEDAKNSLTSVKNELNKSLSELNGNKQIANAGKDITLNVDTVEKVSPTIVKRLSEIRQEATTPTESSVKRLAQIREEATAKESILKSEPKPIDNSVDDLIQTKEPRLRDKVYNLLDEQEKAALARLAAKKGRVSSMPIDQWADHAVVLAAQVGKGTIKLADATEYLVKEFGEAIRPHAQAILNKSKGIIQETERRATKEAQEARAFNNADSGDTSTFRSKVSRDLKKDKTSFSKKYEEIRTQFVDDLAPLEGLEKKITGKVASAEKSIYKAGRLFRGVPEKANQIIKNRLAPIVNGIEKQGHTSKDLGDYALAVHAKDVNARDIKSGFTNREIDNVINQLGSPEMEAARKQLIKLNDDMLKQLVDNQVITQDLVDILKDRYPNYMPLFRQLDDEAVGFEGGLSNALSNVTSPIKKLKGSEKQVIDPLENMVKNVFQSTNAAERNKVSLQLTELAKKDVDNNFIRKLEDFEDVGRKNVVTVLENGEKVRYEVEPEVYKALLNLDKESSNTLIKIFQKPASLLRAGATLTPEFSLRNPLRDVVQAFVTSSSGFNPLIDFPVGLIQSISKGNLYKKWVDELGAFGNIISNDRQVHQEALERVLKESPGKKFVNIVNGKSLIKVLRAITDVTESATKVGEFRAALRKGASPQEAAYRSRDIMDFGRAGTSIRQTNKIVAFLNANIQGKSKLLRAFKANPAGFTARAFTSITVPTVGVFLMQKYMANDAQKATIEESPAWMTDTFWLVPIPGTDQVARIPKPFDIGALFSNLPERALKYTYNNDKEAFDGFAKKSIADGAIPGMITGLTPIIEGMSNYSFFRGSSIIPQREDGINYADQYDVNTTETAKGLAKAADFVTGGKGMLKNFSSPRVMDNTIKGLTAGLGSYATSAIDVMLDKFNFTDNPSRPAKGLAQQPLAKAFLVNPNQSGKSTEQLYNLKTDLTTDKGSAKLRGEPFKDDAKLGYINDKTGSMSDISKEIRAIENSRTLTSNQKRDKIDVLVKKRNEIATKSMNYIKSKSK